MKQIKIEKKRKAFIRAELARKALTYLRFNSLLPKSIRGLNGPSIITDEVNEKYRVSKTNLVNSCVFTGRTRGVFRATKVSRHQLKRILKKSTILGFKSSSW